MIREHETVYIAGPMTNRPHFNFPAFDAVALELRELGYDVSNPHDHDKDVYPGIDDAAATLIGDVIGIAAEVGFSFADAMQWDLREVARCDYICLLPEWETSTGARAERFVAEMTGSVILLATYADDRGLSSGWHVYMDTNQKRMCGPAVEAPELDPQYIAVAGEVRVIDQETGGAKGQKLARFDLLPYDALYILAEHFGKGAEKYEPRNWERGYDWGLSFAAAMRHGTAWWQGEEIDDEGFEHLTAFAWHALVLLSFSSRQIGTDSRPASPAA